MVILTELVLVMHVNNLILVFHDVRTVDVSLNPVQTSKWPTRNLYNVVLGWGKPTENEGGQPHPHPTPSKTTPLQPH